MEEDDSLETLITDDDINIWISAVKKIYSVLIFKDKIFPLFIDSGM